MHVSPLTGEGERDDAAIASAAACRAISTRVVCPAHGCTLVSSICCCLPYSSTTKTISGNWERPWDKHEEMDLCFFSWLWTGLLHVHCFWGCLFFFFSGGGFDAFEVLQLILAGPRFCFLYILIKINVKL